MPRGSRPGERRGGRQRGTPNKKTVLKNAVFMAAAQEPNRSPLDFMLALMRDPQVDLDDRIELAAKAAPFVHARPAPVRTSDDLKFGKLEAKPAAANGGGGEGEVAGGSKDAGAGGSDGEGLSPLDFLLSVMADPAADSEQRIKAAAVAARYKHAVAVPDPEVPSIVVADKFGFTVAPELARAERDDRLREAALGTILFLQKRMRKRDSVEAKRAQEELEQKRHRRRGRGDQMGAHRRLKEKNKLNAADAKHIEEAFRAKLFGFAIHAGEGAPSQNGKQSAENTDGHKNRAKSDKPSPSVDKSVLTHPEPRRVRDREHVHFVAQQTCLVCGRQPCDAHHLRFAQNHALGRKVSDEFTVPLCRGHHRELHRHGDEAGWWEKLGLDPTRAARALWLTTHPQPQPVI